MRIAQSDGWQAPIHFATIATNGGTLVGSFESAGEYGLAPKFFYTSEIELKLPIHMLLVDGQTGRAARVEIAEPDQTSFAVQ
jgi:hypothetical protein